VSLLLVGLIALLQNQNSLASQAEQNLSRIVAEKTLGYDNIFRRIQQEVEAVAAYAASMYAAPTPREDVGYRLLMPWTGNGYGTNEQRRDLHDEILRMQRIGQVLQPLVAKNPYLTLGYFASETALTVFDQQKVVDVIEAIKAFDPRQRPWYIQAGRGSVPIWTDLYVDANTKKLTVTAAAPVRDAGGRLFGVAGLDVLLQTLQNDILAIQIGYENEPFMLNRDGHVIVRRNMEQTNTDWDKTYKTDNLMEAPNPGFRSIVIDMVAGKAGIRTFAGDDRQQNYVAFAPVPTVGASLGVIVPRSEIVRPVRESGKLVLLVMAVFVLLSIGIGVWLGNQVSRPIQDLTVLVDKASKGLLEVEEIPIRRRDEVGVLAVAFNRMLSNLATVVKELEQREKKSQ
ncbi:MAG: PDC sensor domain-containing protein, partial [Candidatus Cryosericum sp.]